MLVERLEHYFSTYKMVPGEPNKMQISGKYGFDHAKAVIEAARADYEEKFGEASEERRRPAPGIGESSRSIDSAFCMKRMSAAASNAAAGTSDQATTTNCAGSGLESTSPSTSAGSPATRP